MHYHLTSTCPYVLFVSTSLSIADMIADDFLRSTSASDPSILACKCFLTDYFSVQLNAHCFYDDQRFIQFCF